MKIIQTILLVQKKGYMNFLQTFEFFVRVFELPDKKLRQMVFHSLVVQVDTLVKTKAFFPMETRLVAILQKLIFEGREEFSRKVLKLLIRLYYKGVWKSNKLVNLIAGAIDLRDQKSSQMVANFLITSAEAVAAAEDSGDEDEDLKEMTKSLGKKYKYSKKKIEKMEQQIKNLKKKQRRREELLS